MLAAALAAVGQSRVAAADPADPAPPPIAAMRERLIANFQADQRALQRYQHLEHVITGKDGNREGRTFRVWYVRGHEVSETIAVDGRQLSPEEIAAEDARAEQRAQDAAQRDDAPSSVLEFDHVQYSFAKLADDYRYGRGTARTWEGRTVWVYPATPNPAAPRRTRAEKVLLHSAGEIWVDAGDEHVMRINIHLTSPVTYLLGVLAKVDSAHIELAMERHAPGEWLPLTTGFDLHATVLLFDSISRSKQQTFYDYARP